MQNSGIHSVPLRKEIERMLKKLVDELEKRQYDKCPPRALVV